MAQARVMTRTGGCGPSGKSRFGGGLAELVMEVLLKIVHWEFRRGDVSRDGKR